MKDWNNVEMTLDGVPLKGLTKARVAVDRFIDRRNNGLTAWGYWLLKNNLFINNRPPRDLR